MRTEFQHQYDAIERQRAALEAIVCQLSDLQLNWKPKPNAWSTLQIVHHLVLSDEAIGRARSADQTEAEAPLLRVLPRAWRRAMILGALRHGIILPLPSPDIEPRDSIPLADLLERWSISRSDMGVILDTLRADEVRYSHPVLGPLTAAQMLELGRVHTAYHMRQMQTLQRAPQYPSKLAP